MTPDRTNPNPPRSLAIGITFGVGAAVF